MSAVSLIITDFFILLIIGFLCAPIGLTGMNSMIITLFAHQFFIYFFDRLYSPEW